MRKLVLFLIATFCILLLNAQVTLNATLGTTTGSYTTLKAAFDNINNGTHKGIIQIELTGNIIETTTGQLNASQGFLAPVFYQSISIKPQTGLNISISGNIAGSLISLNDADYVTIDGVGNGTSLVIFNSNTSTSAAALVFNNGAFYNNIKNCTFEGFANASGGIIRFTTSGVQNIDNIIENCTIDGKSVTPVGINLSLGGSTSLAPNTIRKNRIVNCYNIASANNIGINLGNGACVIDSNSIYNTAAISTAITTRFYGIYTNGANSFAITKITNNFIGGNAVYANGTGNITNTGTNTVANYYGIYLIPNNATSFDDILVENNTIKNVVINHNSTGLATSSGIYILTTNCFGLNFSIQKNEVTNISVVNNNGTADFSVIYCEAIINTTATVNTNRPNFAIRNNKVYNLNMSNTFIAASVQMWGIRVRTSASTGTTYPTGAALSPIFNIAENKVYNLTTSNPNSQTAFISPLAHNFSLPLNANVALLPKVDFIKDTIYNISNNAKTNGVVGITCNVLPNKNMVSTDTCNIKNNLIYNVGEINTTDVNKVVIGIGSFNGMFAIANNRIYNLFSNSQSLNDTTLLVGINLQTSFNGNSNIYNNQISLGNGVVGNPIIRGIDNYTNNTNTGDTTINIYNNSVLITGTASGATMPSACIYRGNRNFDNSSINNSKMRLQNNLLVNNRTGSSLPQYTIAMMQGDNFISGYNALLTPDVNNAVYCNGASYNFQNYKATFSQDTNSVIAKYSTTTNYTPLVNELSTIDLFTSPAQINDANLKINTNSSASWFVNGKGRLADTISLETYDIENEARSFTEAIPVDIGADEFTTNTIPPTLNETGSFSNGNTTNYYSFSKLVASILWNNVGTITTRIMKFYPGEDPPSLQTSSYAKAYWDMQVNAGATGYNYDISLLYDTAFLYSAPNEVNTRIMKRDAAWQILTNTVANNTTLNATATNLSQFSQFSITDGTVALPLQNILLSVSSLYNAGALLTWQVEPSSSIKLFELEHSADGRTFAKINNTIPYFNSQSRYSNIHLNANEEQNFYRLKITEATGLIYYSTIVSIKNTPNTFIKLVQNPIANNELSIQYNKLNSQYLFINIYDANGKLVYSTPINTLTPTGTINVPIPSITKGNYWVQINNNFIKQSFSFTKL
jgi:hypothetical protein